MQPEGREAEAKRSESSIRDVTAYRITFTRHGCDCKVEGGHKFTSYDEQDIRNWYGDWKREHLRLTVLSAASLHQILQQDVAGEGAGWDLGRGGQEPGLVKVTSSGHYGNP